MGFFLAQHKPLVVENEPLNAHAVDDRMSGPVRARQTDLFPATHTVQKNEVFHYGFLQ